MNSRKLTKLSRPETTGQATPITLGIIPVRPTIPALPQPNVLKRYIGLDPPVITHSKPLYREPDRYEDTDNCPQDPEQAGWHNHTESE